MAVMAIPVKNMAPPTPAKARERLVVIGDSLAMPRSVDGEEVLWSQTWPSLLGAAMAGDFEVVNFSARAKNSNQLVNPTLFLEQIEWVRPKVIIVQIGVVDCAPRIFTNKEKRVLKWLPSFLRESIIRGRSNNRQALTAKDPLGKVEVHPAQFRQNFEDFVGKLARLPKMPKLMVMPIVANLQEMEAKSPGYSSNMALYNDILSEVSEGRFLFPKIELDWLSTSPENFCKDGYHLSPLGNQRLYELLLDVFDELLTN